jgi:hypothetical protein
VFIMISAFKIASKVMRRHALKHVTGNWGTGHQVNDPTRWSARCAVT